MRDLQYLKKYVQIHPDNRMAWYLLGKEYEAEGQEGKALYCYIQSGEVYEAFESRKTPEDIRLGQEARIIQTQARRELRGLSIRRTLITLMLLLLLWIPRVDSPGIVQPVIRIDSEQAASIDVTRQTRVFNTLVYNKDGLDYSALGDLMNPANKMIQHHVLLGIESDGKWLMWNDQMPVVYSILHHNDSGRTAVQAYDPKLCDCTPPDATKLQEQAVDWINSQETLLVLYSALMHYKEETGKLPSEFADLVQPFPNNWLSGRSAKMEDAFPAMIKYIRQQEHSVTMNDENEGQPDSSGSVFSAAEQPYFTTALEVIVDKQNHRLAVVSGQVIVRSYSVGLGGDRTPEGSFRITDRVINPNGSDRGEFGSRGMQLSTTNYAIHGTDEPDSIGKDESLGCIRMKKEDIEELFDVISTGTKVTIGKGILPDLGNLSEQRFQLKKRQDQTNPQKKYKWL